MRFSSLLFFLCLTTFLCTCVSAQTQIGNTIHGSVLNRQIGESVAINADGTRVIIGSPGGNLPEEGFAQVFELNGDEWTQLGENLGGNGERGPTVAHDVAISADGNRVAYSIVFDNDRPAEVRIMDWDGSQWVIDEVILGIDQDDDSFGFSIALSADGNVIVIGSPYRTGAGNVANFGAVEVFRKTGTLWTLSDDFGGGGPNENLGFAVDISADGNRIAYTSRDGTFEDSRNSGYTLVYDYDGSSWSQVGTPFGGNGEFGGQQALGLTIDMTPDGNAIMVGGIETYRVVAFNGTDWEQVGDNFEREGPGILIGEAIALADDGERLYYSSPYQTENGGGVYGERLVDGEWTQGAPDLTHPEGDFGFAIALSGNFLAVTQPTGDNDAGQGFGSVRIYNVENLTATDNPLPAAASVWPNPAGGVINVSGVRFTSARIVDAYGRVVRSVAGTNATISTAGLTAGPYFLRLRTETGWATGRFVKR